MIAMGMIGNARTWLLVASGVLAGVLVVGVVLQVLWIRTRLDQLRQVQMSRRSACDVQGIGGNRSNVTMYSLVVDAPATARLNDVNRVAYAKVQGMLPDRTFVLPHTCGNVAQQRNVVPRRKGVMACKQSPASRALVDDVSQGRVTYVVVNKQVLLMAYDEDVANAVRQELSSGSGVGALSALDILIVYAVPVGSGNGDASQSSSSCQVSMRPFMGSMTTLDDDATDGLDMRLVLNLSSGDAQVPMQLVAYTTS